MATESYIWSADAPTEKMLERFKNGELVIPCSKMVLRQQVESDPEEYSGKGFIRQDTGRLVFEIILDQNLTNLLERTLNQTGLEPGTLIPRSEYYELHAWDFANDEWTCGYADFSTESGVGGASIRGELSSIQKSAERKSGKNSVNLWIRSSSKIPANKSTTETIIYGSRSRNKSRMNVAEFRACGCDFHCRSDDGILYVHLESDLGLPEMISHRVIEALRFVLGESSLLICTHEAIGPQRKAAYYSQDTLVTTGLMPPVRYGTIVGFEDVWQLFEKYLDFIWNYPNRKYHPVSAWLTAIRNAAQVPISPLARGLALGVGVEGALHELFPSYGAPSKEASSNISSLAKYVATWEGEESLKKRVAGSIQAMATTRAQDRLYALESAGVVSAKHIASWKKLRNAAAHARPPEDEELQEWIDASHATEALLYRLIFAAIGYTGNYTDYSSSGWPNEIFRCDI